MKERKRLRESEGQTVRPSLPCLCKLFSLGSAYSACKQRMPVFYIYTRLVFSHSIYIFAVSGCQLIGKIFCVKLIKKFSK